MTVGATTVLAALIMGLDWVWRRPATVASIRLRLAVDSAAMAVLISPFAFVVASARSAQRIVHVGWLLFVLTIAGAALGARLLRLIAERAWPRSVSTSAIRMLGLIALVVLWREADVWVGLYPVLHRATVILASLGLAGAFYAEQASVSRGGPARAAVGVSLVLASAAYYPSTSADREFIRALRPTGGRWVEVAAWIVDLDRDGSSPVFGGGDCDDLDPTRSPSAWEVVGNGIDEDCDGRDLATAASRRAPRPDARRAGLLAEAARARPMVVVLVDALRADRMERDDFPNLRRLARDSLYFSNAYSPASSTSRSVPSMLTGRAVPTPGNHNLFEMLRASGRHSALVANDLTVEILSNRLTLPDSIGYPCTRGVDEIAEVSTVRASAVEWGHGVASRSDRAVTHAAFGLLESLSPPDFLWVHYFDLHQWAALTSDVGTPAERYDSILRETDALVGEWLSRAPTINLIFVSDHGESLGEHDFVYHTTYVYESLVRVPLAILVPGVPPERVSVPVTTTDLAPTVAALLAVPGFPTERSLTGVGPDASSSDSQFVITETGHASLVDGLERLMWNRASGETSLRRIVPNGPEVVADPTSSHTEQGRLLERLRSLMGTAAPR